MVPDFSFVSLKEMGNVGLVGSKLGFSEAKDISSDIFHLKKDGKYIRSFVVESYTVDVLKIDAEYLFFPDFLGVKSLTGVNFLICFSLVGKR